MDQVRRTDDGKVTLPAGPWETFPEQNRHVRGHTFYPSFEALAAIPALYATEDQPIKDKTVHLHYFAGACDWYVAELDPRQGLAFGWTRLTGAEGELGYFHLASLEELHRPGAVSPTPGALVVIPQVLVERDLDFAPCPAWTCIPGLTG